MKFMQLSAHRIRLALVLFICCVLATSSARSADSWVRMMGNGFGDMDNIQIAEFHVFKGRIYAGGSRNPLTGVAQLWRSSDGQSWSQVTSFSPSFTANRVGAIISFGDSGGANPQFIYLGTNNANGAGSIYRSTDGASWTQINEAGSGWVAGDNGFISPHLVVKDNFLYAGTQNLAGGQVWRRPVDDSGPWAKVIDFSTVDTTANGITYLYVFNNVIYVGTGIYEGAGGPGHVYASASGDPGTWSKNTGAGDGFGNPNNIAITSMVDFSGFLYASTRNVSTGGELYRSADAVTWTRIAANGLGSARNIELHNLRVAQNQIWLATLARSPSLFQVWRSSDGFNFVQSNVDGFGDPGNTSTSGSTVGITIGFGDSVYWGGTNEVTGAQVWRLDSTPASPTECLFNWAESSYPSLFAPAGATTQLAAPYAYRHYTQTNAYLGTSSTDNHLYYLGPASGNALLDAGLVSGWLATAGCQ